jgi:hypothetical protein
MWQMNGFLPFFVQPRLVPIIADEKTLLNPGKLLKIIKSYQIRKVQHGMFLPFPSPFSAKKMVTSW